MTKEAKKAAKQEKKLKILLGGYMVGRQRGRERERETGTEREGQRKRESE